MKRRINFNQAKLINVGKQIDTNKVDEVCSKALAKFGPEAQLHVMMEECAEFIVAANHSYRKRPDCLNEIIEEAADVQICMWQMQILISRMGRQEDFIDMINAKLARLEERINAE